MDEKTQETVVDTAEQEKEEKTLGQKIKNFFTGKEDEGKEEKKDDNPTAEEKADDPQKEASADDMKEAIEQARKDAVAEYIRQQEEEARKAKLTPEELKAEEDAAKDKKIAELEHDLMVRNSKEKAVQLLDSKNLPVGLADILNYQTEETAQASLDTVVKVFGECLENAVKDRLKGKTPTGLNSTGDINSFADAQARIYKQMGVSKEEK